MCAAIHECRPWDAYSTFSQTIDWLLKFHVSPQVSKAKLEQMRTKTCVTNVVHLFCLLQKYAPEWRPATLRPVENLTGENLIVNTCNFWVNPKSLWICSTSFPVAIESPTRMRSTNTAKCSMFRPGPGHSNCKSIAKCNQLILFLSVRSITFKSIKPIWITIEN